MRPRLSSTSSSSNVTYKTAASADLYHDAVSFEVCQFNSEAVQV